MIMTQAEKYYAGILSKQGVDYKYPVDFIQIGKQRYRADFYLIQTNTFVEVVGTRQAYYANRKKYELVKKLRPDIKLIIVDRFGNPFPKPALKGLDKIKLKESPMSLRIQIAVEFMREREKQKLSKREIAIASQTQPQRYGEWEEGKGNITADSIQKVSKALGKEPVFKLR